MELQIVALELAEGVPYQEDQEGLNSSHGQVCGPTRPQGGNQRIFGNEFFARPPIHSLRHPSLHYPVKVILRFEKTN